jgi:hypothetical protein
MDIATHTIIFTKSSSCLDYFTVKREATGFSETSVHFYQSSRRKAVDKKAYLVYLEAIIVKLSRF